MKLDPTTTSANGGNQKTIQKPKASEADAERALFEIIHYSVAKHGEKDLAGEGR